MNILLIEDNPVEARYLTGLFRNERNVVIGIAESLAAGIAKTQAMPYPDVVLLDLELPDSEFEVTLPRFLKECPTVPVFISTSLDNLELARKLGYLGAIGYSLKQGGARHILHLLACAIGANQRDQEQKTSGLRLKETIERQLDELKAETSTPIVPVVAKPKDKQ